MLREARLALAPRHALVDHDGLVAGEIVDEADEFADRLARHVPGEIDVAHHDGTGIDEGIARNALLDLELDDGIEGIARGLAPDAAPELVADLAERLVSANTFETDWMEKGMSASPPVTIAPSAVITAMPKRSNGTLARPGI